MEEKKRQDVGKNKPFKDFALLYIVWGIVTLGQEARQEKGRQEKAAVNARRKELKRGLGGKMGSTRRYRAGRLPFSGKVAREICEGCGGQSTYCHFNFEPA